MATYTHDPAADLDYGFSWLVWLDGDTITTSTWAITKIAPAPDATLVLSASSHDASTTRVWADGGTAGKTYTITNHIVTTAGREDDRSHVLTCANR